MGMISLGIGISTGNWGLVYPLGTMYNIIYLDIGLSTGDSTYYSRGRKMAMKMI